MNERIPRLLALRAFARGFIIWTLAIHAFGLRGQEIRVRVVNARNGKPITNECINVSLGPWYGADLLAPTNKDGVVVLHFENNQVTADAAPSHACYGNALLGPKSLPSGFDSFGVSSDEYGDCQEWAKVTPGQTLEHLLNRAPRYPIKKILESGIVASNRCGKYKAKAIPGELVFYVRPRSFLERMRE